ncbi:uncharacterized protein F5891DRAFT_982999 [Suillus fuscotomentosus]|uniref:Uncharacterized protein n=1 Tax=Suillus fuscotomentosus TaxID=1912939 RepID=A0AAD4HIR1_9AGAM|nr:uncharacterized protein F5891DRAFT_982999 [Suillus fuscotomentosus]KAG1896984.1 hypothetical protein F5891DRAFT_982999 [Suillus fuscotomentosus]
MDGDGNTVDRDDEAVESEMDEYGYSGIDKEEELTDDELEAGEDDDGDGNGDDEDDIVGDRLGPEDGDDDAGDDFEGYDDFWFSYSCNMKTYFPLQVSHIAGLVISDKHKSGNVLTFEHKTCDILQDSHQAGTPLHGGCHIISDQ